MYEQFTGGHIVIVNECNIKQFTQQNFNFKQVKLAKRFFQKLFYCRESM